MRRLSSFTQISLDGYYADPDGDFQWAHHHDPEWNEFVASNASSGGALVFGRITYELMASFWPTPQAMEMMPVVAQGMNAMPKIVFSRTLDEATWSNTTLYDGNLVSVIEDLKKSEGPDLAILGSGRLLGQLAAAGLVDEFQIVVNPIILGGGRPLFEGIVPPIPLKLIRQRTFQNGCVLMCYAPA